MIVGIEDQHGAFFQMQVHVVLHVDGTGHPNTAGYYEMSAAQSRHFLEAGVDGFRTVGVAVAYSVGDGTFIVAYGGTQEVVHLEGNIL